MEPLDFFLGANLYQKLLFFCDFGGRKATFLSKLSAQCSAVKMF